MTIQIVENGKAPFLDAAAGVLARMDFDNLEQEYDIRKIFFRTYVEAKDWARAEEQIMILLQMDLTDAEMWSDLGGVLFNLGRVDEAERAVVQALKLDINCKSALANAAAVLEIKGHYDEALPLYSKALSVDPSWSHGRYQHALLLLARGDLKAGWDGYEARKYISGENLHGFFSCPYWDGSDLKGKNVVIWTEQGYGDEIFQAAFFNRVIWQAREVTIVCSRTMKDLFKKNFVGAKIVSRKELGVLEGISFDFQISLSELGRHCVTDKGAYLAGQYLYPNAEKVSHLKQQYQLATGKKRIVGLSWKSFNRDLKDQKSTTLEMMKPILEQEGYGFVSLQYGEITEEEKKSGLLFDSRIDTHLSLVDFADQVSACDLVISVSNTTVHMAGALRVKTLAIIPEGQARMWYWFINDKQSIWYPSVSLFRQKEAGDWKTPIEEIAQILKEG